MEITKKSDLFTHTINPVLFLEQIDFPILNPQMKPKRLNKEKRWSGAEEADGGQISRLSLSACLKQNRPLSALWRVSFFNTIELTASDYGKSPRLVTGIKLRL